MSTYFPDAHEEARLSEFCVGKTISKIGVDDDVEITFSDGSFVCLSTLGGVEIKELRGDL